MPEISMEPSWWEYVIVSGVAIIWLWWKWG
jgi:hypothetical protein